jgi:hypothetical protein
MKYLPAKIPSVPAIIPGESVKTLKATIGKSRSKINPKILKTRSIGDTVKSVVKKGIGFGAAGAALTGAAYYAFEPERNYAKAPKTYEPRDLRSPVIYRGLEDFE